VSVAATNDSSLAPAVWSSRSTETRSTRRRSGSYSQPPAAVLAFSPEEIAGAASADAVVSSTKQSVAVLRAAGNRCPNDTGLDPCRRACRFEKERRAWLEAFASRMQEVSVLGVGAYEHFVHSLDELANGIVRGLSTRALRYWMRGVATAYHCRPCARVSPPVEDAAFVSWLCPCVCAANRRSRAKRYGKKQPELIDSGRESLGKGRRSYAAQRAPSARPGHGDLGGCRCRESRSR